MAGSASRSTEQVKEQEKQTQREAACLTPCCIPGKSGEERSVPGKGTARISGPAVGHGTKASGPSSPGPLAYPRGGVPPACTWISPLMAFLQDMGESDQHPAWTGSRWLQGASAAAE